MTTRRSIVKAGAGLAAILAAGKAPAAFIRSAIAARNAMMAGGGKSLPYDSEVEYLETVATSGAKTYVDTGIAPSDDLGFVVDFMCTYLNRANHLVGATDGSSTGRFELFVRTTNADSVHMSVYWGGAPDNTNDERAWYMRRATVGVNWMNSRITEIDGVYLSDLPHVTSGSARNAYLMGYNSNGTATVSSSVRFYSAKFSIGSILVRDFIPVRKGTVGYLYDRVTGKLYGNQGTGDFGVGQDVVPVEWLEGGQLDSGIAFIDTGYTPNSSTKIESTSAILSAWGYSGRFGANSRLTFGAAYGNLYLAQGDHYYLEGWTAGTFYSFVNDIANRTVSVEGVGSTSTAAVSNWYPQLYPIYLFASNVAPIGRTNVNGKMLDSNSLGRIRMKSCNIWENDIPVRKFRPVRVGTDATSWEGAMMDVLTRKIYRNADTGAFIIGPDI